MRKRLFDVFIFKEVKLLQLTLFVSFASCGEKQDRFYEIPSFSSKFIKEKRVSIFLPKEYHSSDKRYPVLYMHDGQMLFDSTTTWNGQEWGVDEVIDQLVESQSIENVVVIGIWNGGNELRHPQYFPQKPFESLPQTVQDSLYNLYHDQGVPLFANPVQSDKYLKFIVSELKPYVDKNYRTKNDRRSTFIAGSSMGGLISMYAICEYPEIFGGAACLSTHWPGIFTPENNPIPDIFLDYLSNHLPDAKTHKLYFDYGTETLDALYEPYQKRADSIIRNAKYDSSNFLTLKFEGHKHEERFWKNRLHIPLKFLLKMN
ncbi:MAG: alpha/beta hydrolase [Ekhidna sp.]|nr:alpha/beta hydrolase [Ekhidna sp.]